MAWETKRLRAAYDRLAPDGSEIRDLVRLERGSLVHCTLPRGQVTQAVRHQTVEEVWYCVAGSGELWRADDSGHDEIVRLQPGTSVSIPCGVSFQFRANATLTLELVIATMPPWPGASEAVPVRGMWSAPAT